MKMEMNNLKKKQHKTLTKDCYSEAQNKHRLLTIRHAVILHLKTIPETDAEPFLPGCNQNKIHRPIAFAKKNSVQLKTPKLIIKYLFGIQNVSIKHLTE
jgi:hypothetical protein